MERKQTGTPGMANAAKTEKFDPDFELFSDQWPEFDRNIGPVDRVIHLLMMIGSVSVD